MALQLGSFLVAFSPSLALGYHVVGERPILVSLAIVAAGFWLAGVLALGVATAPLASPALLAVAGVLFQEASRWALVAGYGSFERAVAGSRMSKGVLPLDDWSSALACGLGFGTMHAAVLCGSLLAASLGEATLFVGSCADLPLVALTGKARGVCVCVFVCVCCFF